MRYACEKPFSGRMYALKAEIMQLIYMSICSFTIILLNPCTTGLLRASVAQAV